MDGFQTIVRLRADPAFRDLPILALAPDDTEVTDLSLLAGNTRVLRADGGPWKERIAEELREMLAMVAAPLP
jgi:CheY-like chemotaxis protein